MDCKICCLRVFLIIIICMLWLFGAAIFGFTLWLRVDFWISQYVTVNGYLSKYEIVIYICIAFGSSVVVFGIIGIIGAAVAGKYSKLGNVALIVFLVYLVLVVLLMIGGTAYAYVYRDELEREVKHTNVLKEYLKASYGMDPRITTAFDILQSELDCCGGTSFMDYKESTWAQGDYEITHQNRDNKAPLSCCTDYFTFKDAHSPQYKYCNMYKEDPTISGNQLSEPNPKIHQTPCNEAVVDFFYKNISIVAAITCSIVGIELLGIILSSLLINHVCRRTTEQPPDDAVYEMARSQEKSPYPTRGGPYANLYNNC